MPDKLERFFRSKVQTIPLYSFQIREEFPSYSTPPMQSFESFDNPMAGTQSFKSQNDDGANENPQVGKALYDFSAGGDDEVCGIQKCHLIIFNMQQSILKTNLQSFPCCS